MPRCCRSITLPQFWKNYLQQTPTLVLTLVLVGRAMGASRCLRLSFEVGGTLGPVRSTTLPRPVYHVQLHQSLQCETASEALRK